MEFSSLKLGSRRNLVGSVFFFSSVPKCVVQNLTQTSGTGQGLEPQALVTHYPAELRHQFASFYVAPVVLGFKSNTENHLQDIRRINDSSTQPITTFLLVPKLVYIHTYIHNWSLQPFKSGLLTQFLTPLTLCVLFLYISGRTYSLKSTPNGRYFKNLFMSIFIYCDFFSAKKMSPCYKVHTKNC